jgi:glycosyltransferase involved in cell wall biosynthesis
MKKNTNNNASVKESNIKRSYLINGFQHMYDAFIRGDKTVYDYTFLFPKSSRYDFLTNYLLYKKWVIKGRIKEFEYIHINCWENFLNYKYVPGQISICHSHGIHIGLDKNIGLAQSEGMKKFFGKFYLNFLNKKLIENMKNFDINYVAIPNALPFAKKLREDSLWLPNPVNTDLFKNYNREVYHDAPQILLPTRFHDVKNPAFAFKIFDSLLKTYPGAKLHLINYPKRFTHGDKYLHLIDLYKKKIVWHPFMKRDHLPEFYSQFDLILGAFNPHYYYANLNLVELEAMACKIPVVTHDKYELIKTDLNKLPDLALKLLENPQFKKTYITRCYDYTLDMHGEKSVFKLHQKNLKKFG